MEFKNFPIKEKEEKVLLDFQRWILVSKDMIWFITSLLGGINV